MAEPVSVAWVNLTNGGMSGGFRKYNENILPRLAADPRFTRLSVHSPADMPDVTVPPNCDEYRWPTHEFLRGFPTLRRQIAARRPTIVYVPMHRYVNTNGIPLIVMYRNMEAATQPWGENGIAEALKNVARRIDARRAMRRAAGVIAVSQFVADFLRDEWHIDPGKTRLIYHGVAEDHVEPRRPAAVPADVPFIFTAGSIRPFRGLEDLIEGAALLPEALRHYRVVIGGRLEGRVRAYYNRLLERSRELGVNDRIIWAGMLQQDEMVWCFRNCMAFAMTSRVEACPNTALEAMNQGAACVATTNPPMPEFFGDTAKYYPAGDGGALARSLGELVADREARVRLQEAGRERMRRFTWRDTYDRTADFLLEIARQSRGALAPNTSATSAVAG